MTYIALGGTRYGVEIDLMQYIANSLEFIMGFLLWFLGTCLLVTHYLVVHNISHANNIHLLDAINSVDEGSSFYAMAMSSLTTMSEKFKKTSSLVGFNPFILCLLYNSPYLFI